MNIREDAAKYYDLQSFPIDDIGYYEARVPGSAARILELGCGTGRVLVPLAHRCAYLCGVDSSAAMLALCAEKVERAGLPPDRVRLVEGDVSQIHLAEQFDLITAPFRVFQLLETDAHVDALMRAIREHLAPGGTAILNAFHPNRGREEMVRSWCEPGEHVDGETPLGGGDRLVRLHRRPRVQAEPLVVYPELIYRRYDSAGALTDEAIMKIAMRCWYPHELRELVLSYGFTVKACWGGYSGETWGQGSELVIEFGA